MADGFEPFHVPQQSRRDKLRVVVQNNPSCEESSATLHGCAGLLPLYDPALISSGILTYSNAASHGFNQPCKPNPVCNVKEEGVNLMSCVGIGGFMNAPSSSSTQSHHDHPYLFPHSSLANPNSSIQDINNNPFLFTPQNIRNFDQSFNGGEMVNSTMPGQGLSLSLSSHHTHSQHHYYNQPSELNLQRYESAIFGEKGIEEYVGRSIIDVSGGSMLTDASKSSVPLGPFTGYASILKGSRFLKPAQQLLEELCDLGRGIYTERSCEDSYLMDPSTDSLSGTGIGTVDDPLTCGDGIKHRRKKMSLISMLDEVYRRYRQYYQQMQAVVASFESVAGLSNAAPYTSFALKAMSKHFRCLKNAITDQLRFTSKVFGEGSFRKDEIHSFGTTDRGLHSQTSIHSSSIIEQQHVWRPQRGLPERAVAVLRAWLFEHFLHPYPTDTDKQMLARQTGLSRNQVSNWFINARVRLWKPMVEEIHTLETRQGQKASEPEDQSAKESSNHIPPNVPLSSNKPPQSTTTITTQTQDSLSKRCRNEHLHISHGREPLTNFSCNNSSSHNHIGVGVNTTGGNNAVSLTLGLHHNNGIGLSAPFPMNIAQRFGIEVNSRGYAMDGYEAQNAHFGKDIGGQQPHDFVG